MIRLVIIFAVGIRLTAAEFAVLRTGAVLRADRIERQENRVVLVSGQGRTELDPGDIASFEREDTPPPIQSGTQGAEAPARAEDARINDPRMLVSQAAERHGLPPEFVRSVAGIESAFRPEAVSRKGALGLMQLMPKTAEALQANPLDPAQNADAGVRLLRALLLKYQNDPNPVRRALAAYNAGEAAVDRYHGVPPYRETQQYIEKVLERYWKEMKAK
jgi:soluble lytic murein transglycosylase-like protein